MVVSSLLLLVGVLTSVSGLSSGALAQGQACEVDVVDTTGNLDRDQVVNTIDELGEAADVRVRTFESVADGDVEAELQRLVDECFTVDGEVADNYFLLGISMGDRRTEVLYGRALTQPLASDVEAIMADDINPRLADGDLTGGVVAGLVAVGDRLSVAESPAGSDGVATPASPDDDGGGLPAGAAAAAVAGVGVIGGGGYLISRRRKLMAARTRFDEQTAEPLARMGAVRERWLRLSQQAEVWERLVSGRTLDELRERVADARQESTGSERAATLLNQATPNGIGEASTAELRTATNRLTELVEALDRHHASLDRLTSFEDTLNHLRASLPTKRDLLVMEFGEANQLAEERRMAGWVVADPVGRLAEAEATLQPLDLDSFPLDLLDISDTVEQAEAGLFSARHELQTLPDQLAGLKEWAERMAEAAELEQRRVGEAEKALVGISLVHAGASWRWAADHPARALRAIERANELRAAAIAGPVAKQAWDQAGRDLESSGLELLVADELLDEVDALLVDLATAREAAPGLVVGARQELQELVLFVRQHDDDLPARFDVEPAAISRAIGGLENELREARPNYLRVAQTLDRLAARIVTIFTEARGEHEAREALRRQLQREAQRALRALERARAAVGWELIRSQSGRQLDDLEARLQQLLSDKQSSVEDRIDLALDIHDDAVALRELIIARRRRNNTWVVVGGGGFGGGFGGGSGRSSGGGTFGGGTFGGGGGFGGGTFGGGGGFGGGGAGSSW